MVVRNNIHIVSRRNSAIFTLETIHGDVDNERQAHPNLQIAIKMVCLIQQLHLVLPANKPRTAFLGLLTAPTRVHPQKQSRRQTALLTGPQLNGRNLELQKIEQIKT